MLDQECWSFQLVLTWCFPSHLPSPSHPLPFPLLLPISLPLSPSLPSLPRSLPLSFTLRFSQLMGSTLLEGYVSSGQDSLKNFSLMLTTLESAVREHSEYPYTCAPTLYMPHTHTHTHILPPSPHGSRCEDEGCDVGSLLPHCEFFHSNNI